MKIRVGIRREDKNPWERRVPLIPSHVREILQNYPMELWMQPSDIRVFSDQDFIREGAKIEEDLSSCSVVFAVKEIPLDFFLPGKAYMFFSHTIKGQKDNMPMLGKMKELGCTLIDYEKVMDEKGRRLVFFGTQAGQAGMIDTLWAFGQRLKYLGIRTPFEEVLLAYQYGSLVDAKESIKKIGWDIHESGFDPSLVPLIFGFAGYGHVSRGAQEIFDLLPFEEVRPKDIQSFFDRGHYTSNRIYKMVFKEEHMVKPSSASQKFQLQEYYEHPERYQPIFESFIPYISVLVNCVYWAPQYPHFVTKTYLRKLWEEERSPRLKVIGDISCDVEGAVECTLYATNPGKPVYVYDPITKRTLDGIKGRGVVVMATDNLPAELPLESSLFFSDALLPYVPAIAMADFTGDFKNCDLPYPIKKAVILYNGEFTPEYEYMKNFITK
jgi:saccharopine dehydrogenase (NAD+, L-lysine-forming)